MYNPNTREELMTMQRFMPISALEALRTAKNANADTVIEPSSPVRNVVWMDELRSNPMLPVDSAFLVCLYRHF